MATIHMNVESCTETSSLIESTRSTLDEQVKNLDGKVQSIVGVDWIAPSANEFQSAYQEWASAMRQLLEQLMSLQGRLKAEITEFENTAAKLN